VFDTCVQCDIGFYQPLSFQSTCDPCPTDYTTESLGSTSLDQCIRKYKLGLKQNLPDLFL